LDGYSLAVGTQGKNPKILVYDLRKQSDHPITVLDGGHSQSINSLTFKLSDIVMNKPSTPSLQHTSSNTTLATENSSSLKTLEQIKEEARKNVELKKKQLREHQ